MMQAPLPASWLRGRLALALCATAILFAGAAAYSNAVGLPLLRIEQEVLYETPALQRMDTAIAAETPEGVGPLSRASFGWAAWLTGGAIPAHRAFGIALHLAGALALYGIARRLFRRKLPEPVAALPGLIFAVHPATAYPLDYLLARDTLLASVCTLWALWLYLRAAEPGRPLRPTALAASYFAFLLAWLTGPQALVIPLLVLLCDWLVRGRRGRPGWVLAGYWALLGALIAAYPGPWWTAGRSPFYLLRLTALYDYLRMAVMGQGFALIHGYEGGTPLGAQFPLFGASAAFAVLVFGGFLLARRSVLGGALVWFALAAAAGLAGSGPEGYTEAPLYLALAGLLLAVPWAMRMALGNQTLLMAGGGALGLLIFVAGAGTAARNQGWAISELALWNQASDAAPRAFLPAFEAGRIHTQRGVAAQMSAGQEDRRTSAMETGLGPAKEGSLAEDYLRKAIALRPGSAEAWRLLGQSLLLQDKPDESRGALLAALERAPRDPGVLTALAAYHQQRAATAPDPAQRREALAASLPYFRRAHRLSPLPPQLLAVYAPALMQLGNLPAAQELFAQLAELEEQAGIEESPARRQSRDLTALLGEADRLRTRAREAQDPALRALLEGEALTLERRWLPASYALESALRQGSHLTEAWLFLGLARVSMNQTAGFLEEWPAPPGGGQEPWMQLAQMCIGNGRLDAAEACLEHAARRGVIDLPLVAMADVAMNLRQGRIAFDYYNRALEAYPERPEPALRLFDVAAANGDAVRARGYLGAAEERGATEEQLAPRREQLTAPPSTAGGGRTVIR